MGLRPDLEFTERMWGYVAEGAASFGEGYLQGKQDGNRLEWTVTIRIDDFDAFIAGSLDASARHVPMAGQASCAHIFGEERALEKGATFGLYYKEPQTGERRMSYDFTVKDKSGTTYTFSGYKRIIHDPGTFDILEDHTTLFGTLEWMKNGQKKSARGIIYFHLFPDLLTMLASMLFPKPDSFLDLFATATHWKPRLVTLIRFFLFVSKEASEEYLKNLIPSTYAADYRNWVCKGTCAKDGQNLEFFLFSGIHPKDFPWGGDVGFSDIGLILRDGNGLVRRFALSDRSVDSLELDFKDRQPGTYRYEGDLFEITGGYQVSFTDMRKQETPQYLRRVPGRIQATFTPQFIASKNVPFEVSLERIKEFFDTIAARKGMGWLLSGFDWVSALLKALETWLKQMKPLGYSADLYRLTNVSGSFDLDGEAYQIISQGTLAEGEYGRVAALTIPTLYYNYFCAVESPSNSSSEDAFRIQIRSGTLRSISKNSVTGWVQEVLGNIIGGFAFMDFEVKGMPDGSVDAGIIEPKSKADSLILPATDLLEINNDHYPDNKIFQRRIVALPGTQQKEALAMEEDMSILDLRPVSTDRRARVAAVKGTDRFASLDRVMEATGFFDVLERAFEKVREGKQKTRETFSIVIKPNFSFMYSLTDISTFTDPALVEYLIDRIYDRGFRNITVVEAQSTYATFFKNRDVRTLARYIGLLGEKYAIVDLSENYVSYISPAASAAAGKPTERDVHPVWRDGDFRISFAKNKTHAYAFYTLTIKNIYGALPRGNKFKEYHCNRAEFGEDPIYTPAIELLQDFPVNFGFVDAYFSADGMFGVFADKKPDFTGTIIGGDDLVAVDWIGASKMGLDPKISRYMQLAVKAFGKPEIILIGDHSLYPDWQNVPSLFVKATPILMDRNYSWGLIIYASFSMMDPFFAFKMEGAGLELLRLFSLPLREALLQAVRGGEITWEALAGILSPPSLKDLQQLLRLLSGNRGEA